MNVDQTKLEALLQKMTVEMGAAVSGALVIVGDRLGLYKALAESPATSAELAQRAGCAERYVREWLSAQAASGYVEYDAATQKFSMTPEQATVLADPESPAAMAGGYYGIAAAYKDEPKISAAFKSGRGVGWHEHSECLFCGTERFFAPAYRAFLVDPWIASLDRVSQKLAAGARVADIGCGHGLSTCVMARAFPKSQFFGFDYHDESIARARDIAREEGLANVEFQAAAAKSYPGGDYDLVTMCDCLHDMGDPVGAARHSRATLKPDGTLMLVEPLAGDRLEDNLNPVGRMFYSFSTMVCTPGSLAQEVGLGLGAQAGEARLTAVLKEAGFRQVRRATETPTNMVLEAKP